MDFRDRTTNPALERTLVTIAHQDNTLQQLNKLTSPLQSHQYFSTHGIGHDNHDKQVKTAEVKAVSELDEEIGFLLEVAAVEDSSNLDDDEGECRRRWTAEIQVNRKLVKFKLDSQADVTCVPLCLFKKIMGQQRLVESDINIRAAEFSELQTVGMFISTLRNGNYEIKEKIYVIRRLSEPLLSRRACMDGVMCYLDDILIFASDSKTHDRILRLVLRKLKEAKVTLNKAKCVFGVPRINFLGHILDEDCIRPDPAKIEAVAKMPAPTDVHGVRRFLGMVNHLGRFVENLSGIVAPLNQLLVKGQDFVWDCSQERAFRKLKELLTTQPILAAYDVRKPTMVSSDASSYGLGAVLKQEASIKLEILDKLHAGHFGITKTRLRAREAVWWPGISEEITESVRKCSVCIQEAVSKHEPLIPTNFPTRPWKKIGMDLFKFENKWYLVVIDYYSRFPEVIQLDRLTANVVVRSCKSIFARHGIPETVVSDNGTQFGAAREFANFARQYGFTHVTSSPRFPQSNGMEEAGVKIAKLILKKNQDPSLGLLEYRSTLLENGYSPAELLMGRPEKKGGEKRKDMKSRYDRRCGATDMEELFKGDTVWITDMRIWGIVKQKASTPRSYMVDTPVGSVRRDRFHLRKGDTVQYPADPSTPTFSGKELVENEKTPVVDYPSNDSEDGQFDFSSWELLKAQASFFGILDLGGWYQRTISRRLVANGLHSCRPLRRLPLTPPNRRQRLEWCRARSTWMTEWHRVVFSDESRFCLSSDSRRVRAWRRRGERSNPAAIVERPTVRQRGIMVWGAIAYDSRSPLLRIQGTMTAQRYVDDVLRPVTLPYLQGVPNDLYQQDNARPHTARISQQALQDVQMLPWPPYSPDLSPIEHVWDIIGRRLHALPQPRSEDELWQMVEREWRAIPQDAIRTLIDSLPRRVAACIAVRGGPTCY
ncbi:K02A2.6-like [Cordylochernes scorpioides]|uniref:K02A2.6-like n=1 Tax=Cordylochernes scorpioides TaxID=51811 RepID=A0ABY6LAP2_9ARAC|nr:K02A2.6-like [Cordylochernes scorpioides]